MSESTHPTVGFIGLGNMGAPMAANLLKDGFAVSVLDVRPEAIGELVGLGATAAPSVAQLAESVDVACICVLSEPQVRGLLLGPSGILAHAREGLVVLLHSTISPQAVVDMVEAGRAAGVAVVDAPVSGARMASEAGTLLVMVGGAPDAVEIARPILECVGGTIVDLGEPGKPQAAKLANNMMAVCNEAIVMEAVRFGAAYGLTPDDVLRAGASGTGDSWAVRHYGYFEDWPDQHPDTSLDDLPHRMTKDIRLAVALSQERHVNLPITAVCTQVLPAMYAARWASRSTRVS